MPFFLGFRKTHSPNSRVITSRRFKISGCMPSQATYSEVMNFRRKAFWRLRHALMNAGIMGKTVNAKHAEVGQPMKIHLIAVF